MRKRVLVYLQSEKKPGDVYVHRCTRVPGTQNCVVKVSLVPSFLRLAHADRNLSWPRPDLSPRVASARPFTHAMLVTL